MSEEIDALFDVPGLPKGEVAAPTAPAQADIDALFDVPEQEPFLLRAAKTAAGVGEEGARATISSVTGLVQGIAELGAAGIDTAFGTNTSRAVTEGFDWAVGGLRPETEGGKMAEDILSFGVGFIPIAGWLGRAGKVAKLAKAGKTVPVAKSRFLRTADNFGKSALGQKALSTRARFWGTTAAAAGGFEALFSRDGRTTLSDSFGLGGPLATTPDTGLTGRAEARRRLVNRVKQGVEGSLLSLGIDVGMAGLGAAARAYGASPAGPVTAKVVRNGFDLLASGARRIPGSEAIGRAATKYLTPSGGADPRVFETGMDTAARVDALERLTFKAYQELDAMVQPLARKASRAMPGKGGAQKAEKDMFDYFTGARSSLDEYGPEVVKAADRVADNLGKLRDDFYSEIETAYDRALPGSDRKQKLKVAIDEMRNWDASSKGYLRRVFQRYSDPLTYVKNLDISGRDVPDLSAALAKGSVGKMTPFEETVVEVSKHLHKDTPGTWSSPEALTRARMEVNEFIGLQGVNRNLPPDEAMRLMTERVKSAELGKGQTLFAKDMPRFRMTPSLLTARKEILDSSPKLRQLLGEVTDPKQLVYQTVGDLAKTTEALRFYRLTAESGRVASLSDALNSLSAGGRPVFVSAPDVSRTLTGFDMDPYIQEAMELNRITTVTDPLAQGVPKEFSGNYSPEELIARDKSLLESYGYVRLGLEDTATAPDSALSGILNEVLGGPYGALTGLYVAPETYQALTAPMRIGINGMDEALSIASQAKALSQKMTIVYNTESQVRQIIGNAGALAMTGNLGRDTDFFDILAQYTSSLDELSEAGLERQAKIIALSGVTESDLVVKALQEFQSAGKDLTYSGKLHRVIAKAEGLLPFMRVFETVYSNSDSLFKGMAVVSEQNKLMRVFADAGFDPDNVPLDVLRDMQEQGVIKRLRSEVNPELNPLEVAAADTVKDQFPIYNRVGLIIRLMDKYPLFGNFMSFASENIRNSVNILDKGLSEMSYRASPEIVQKYGDKTASALNRGVRGNGSQRMLSYVAYNAIVPQALVRGSMRATGTTEEEMAAAQRLAPEYTAGQDLVPIKNTKDGIIEYYTLGGVMPHAFVFDSAKAAIRTYNESGELGKGEASQILDGVWAGVKAYADPFTEQTMSAATLLDVLPKSFLGRGGRTVEGAPVYNETDPRVVKVLKSVSHVLNTYVPGQLREFLEVRKGVWEPGRTSRAMLEVSGPQGQEYNLPAEAFRVVTGLTPMELNLKRDFQFSGAVYSTRRTDAKGAAQSILRAPDKSAEEMTAAWEQYLEVLYKEQAKLYRDIQDARTLGLSEANIRRSLVKEAGLGGQEVSALMRGQFYPGYVTSQTLGEIRAQARAEGIDRTTPASQIPIRQLNQLSQSMRGQPLISQPPAKRETQPSKPAPAPVDIDRLFDVPAGGGGSGSRSTQGAAPPPPAFGSMPAPSAPQLPTAPANRASLSPSLLGGDLASQMANMEVAQRLGG
jgi:hypothetical protein